ncbi:hypothetical protein HDV05_008715 [Chytridiales sp. JEL 0842]|nr:hypothetical protein HDV05_008715 [Chytridiales sp. JEL 0842]
MVPQVGQGMIMDPRLMGMDHSNSSNFGGNIMKANGSNGGGMIMQTSNGNGFQMIDYSQQQPQQNHQQRNGFLGNMGEGLNINSSQIIPSQQMMPQGLSVKGLQEMNIPTSTSTHPSSQPPLPPDLALACDEMLNELTSMQQQGSRTQRSTPEASANPTFQGAHSYQGQGSLTHGGNFSNAMMGMNSMNDLQHLGASSGVSSMDFLSVVASNSSNQGFVSSSSDINNRTNSNESTESYDPNFRQCNTPVNGNIHLISTPFSTPPSKPIISIQSQNCSPMYTHLTPHSALLTPSTSSTFSPASSNHSSPMSSAVFATTETAQKPATQTRRRANTLPSNHRPVLNVTDKESVQSGISKKEPPHFHSLSAVAAAAGSGGGSNTPTSVSTPTSSNNTVAPSNGGLVIRRPRGHSIGTLSSRPQPQISPPPPASPRTRDSSLNKSSNTPPPQPSSAAPLGKIGLVPISPSPLSSFRPSKSSTPATASSDWEALDAALLKIDFEDVTVTHLKDVLRERGLSCQGKKVQLVERVQEQIRLNALRKEGKLRPEDDPRHPNYVPELFKPILSGFEEEAEQRLEAIQNGTGTTFELIDSSNMFGSIQNNAVESGGSLEVPQQQRKPRSHSHSSFAPRPTFVSSAGLHAPDLNINVHQLFAESATTNSSTTTTPSPPMPNLLSLPTLGIHPTPPGSPHRPQNQPKNNGSASPSMQHRAVRSAMSSNRQRSFSDLGGRGGVRPRLEDLMELK